MNEEIHLAEAATVGEKVFVVAVLLYSQGAFLTFLKGTDELPEGISTGSTVTNLIWVCIYVGAAYFLLKRCEWRLNILRQTPFLFLLTLLAAMSVLWSEVPWISALRIGALLGTTIVGLYLALRYDSIDLLSLLGWSLAIAAVLSFWVALLIPTYGVGRGDFAGDWMGVYAHKNALGSNMVLAFLVFSVLRGTVEKWKWPAVGLLLLSLVLIVKADSATSIVACVFVASVMFLNGFVRARIKSLFWRLVTLIIAIAVVIGYLNLNSQQVLNALGREENLTGRTTIWYLVARLVDEKPFLGYGYGSVWLGFDGPSAQVWSAMGGQSVYHSHNGFLEVWVECGLAGLILFLLCFFVAFRKSLAKSHSMGGLAASWPLYFFSFLLIFNLVESTFLISNNLFWLLFIVVAIQLSREEKSEGSEASLSTYVRIESQLERP